MGGNVRYRLAVLHVSYTVAFILALCDTVCVIHVQDFFTLPEWSVEKILWLGPVGLPTGLAPPYIPTRIAQCVVNTIMVIIGKAPTNPRILKRQHCFCKLEISVVTACRSVISKSRIDST